MFVNSMSDLFHPRVPFDFISNVFEVMQEASAKQGHIFQVLTKRPGRAVGWWEQEGRALLGEWPANVWIGTSVESRKYAPRLSVLKKVPAHIRFVSAEPLLESVDISPWLEDGTLKWVIVGGESGRGARPMELDWARGIRDQCVASGVSFFLKQLGGSRGKRSGEEAVLDGLKWSQYPQEVNGYAS